MRTVTLPDGTTRMRLETWGEIASHLGVEVRTAQRWERRMGIPIRRLDGGQAVFAFVDELDAWLERKQVPPVVVRDPGQELAPSMPATVVVPQPDLSGVEAAAPVPPRRAWLWTAGVAGVAGILFVAATVFNEQFDRGTAVTPANNAAGVDEFHIVKTSPARGSVAFGGNVEPEWGVYVTLQYSLRSRDEAWLCMIAEVDPVAQSGSVCADPVHMLRGAGTAQTRIVVTNTTANGPVLTRKLRLIVAEKKVCPTVPGNYRSHDVSCFPNPFYERSDDAEFAWTHPEGENRVGLLAVSAGRGTATPVDSDVSVTVSYLLQDAQQATICVSPVTDPGRERTKKPSGPKSRCSKNAVRAGYGTTTVTFAVDRSATLPTTTDGLWIEMPGLFSRYYPFPLSWRIADSPPLARSTGSE